MTFNDLLCMIKCLFFLIIVDWRKAEWDLTGYEKKNIEFDELCSVRGPGLTLMNNPLNYGDASLTCRKFNSMMGLCSSTDAEVRMSQMILSSKNKSEDQCFSFNRHKYWCGFDDLEKENIWKDEFGFDMTYYRSDYPWGPKEPNGRTHENCVSNRITLEGEKIQNISDWNDANCDEHKRCFFCLLERRPVFILRGLTHCLSKHFDSTYKWTNFSNDGNYQLQGFYGSKIKWSRDTLEWIVTTKEISDMNATLRFRTKKGLYPAGLYYWNVKDTGGVCKMEAGEDISRARLHLSSCTNDQFGCGHGMCIDMDKRCDNTNDCLDSSDERNCSLLEKPAWYLQNVAPPFLNGEKKNKIWISVSILNILDINALKTNIYIQFRMTMAWYDLRLKFKNLKEENYKNPVANSENIWIPTLCFHNTETKATTLTDLKSKMSIDRNGSLSYSTPDVLENTHYYKGSENWLTQSRTYDVAFICKYKLLWYPFDTQICHINITMCQLEDESVMELIAPKKISYLADDFAEYTFLKTSVLNGTIYDRMKGVSITLIFQRKIFSMFITIFIPTILIVFVSYLTTFFNNKQWFGHIITINLTVVFVQSL